MRTSAAVAALAVAALVTACGGGTSGGTSSDAAPPAASTQPAATIPVTSTGTAPTAPATTVEGPSHDVTLWFVKDGKPAAVTRKAPKTPEVARQALEQLFLGPTAEEQAQGYSSQIVDGTQLNAIALRDHVATVDVSPDIQAVVPGAPDKGAADQLKLGQIVRTLTQLQNVAWVRFAVNGIEQTFPAPGDGLYAGLLNREIVDAGKDGPPWIQIETVKVDRENVHFAGSADVFEGALTGAARPERQDAGGVARAGLLRDRLPGLVRARLRGPRRHHRQGPPRGVLGVGRGRLDRPDRAPRRHARLTVARRPGSRIRR